MREIVLDTETTGLDAARHRIVEIGCVELIDRLPTGKTFHTYFNPEQRMPKDAQAIHGLTEEFLRDKPVFGDRSTELLLFIGDDSKIVAHNAAFDLAFLNMELEKAWQKPIDPMRTIDTMQLAQRKHPGRNNLDDLCKRYKVKNIRSGKHGALTDANMLTECYLEMLGDKQGGFDFGGVSTESVIEAMPVSQRPTQLPPRPVDIAAHRAFIASAKIKDPIWLDYFEPEKMAA